MPRRHSGTVLLDLMGYAVLYGLLLPGSSGLGRAIRRVIRTLAVTGAGVMGIVAIAGLATRGEAGPIDPWVFLFVYGCFGVFALALARTAWLTRKPRP